MIGTGGKAVHHEVQQPRQANAHRTANPAQGEALTEQVGNLRTSLGRNAEVFGASTELALTIFTEMILFAMPGMTVFLVPGGSACWT